MQIEPFLQAFIVLIVVIDPFGVLPVFMGLTATQESAIRRQIALRATIIGAIVLLSFAFVGDFLLDSLHISEPSFRIAGGVLLLLAAIDMVIAKHSGISSTTKAEEVEANQRGDITVFPLAIPLIAGPGALTSITILMREVEGNFPMQMGIIGILILVLFTNYLILLFATPIGKLLGLTGTNVLTRVFGIILAALAVQFVLDGIKTSLF